jgi:hypothetical protein
VVGEFWELFSFQSVEIFTGGSLAQNGHWRWIFCECAAEFDSARSSSRIDLNLPICGLTMLLVFLFLNLRTPSGSVATKFKKIDYVFVFNLSNFKPLS